jgi:AGZA family xanthine/uracil permease-like MFS transporter
VGEGCLIELNIVLNKINEFFKVTESHSSFKQELIAGITVFFTAVYIIIVNPLILSDAGIPIEMGLLATILVSVAGSLLMGFWGKAPIIQIPGMGVNAFFTYTIVQSA